MPSDVLFVCVHNAGRSQMAAALLEHHGQSRVTVRSAGSEPSDRLNPVVVEVMNEIGIDLVARGSVPKRLDPDMVKLSDVVVTTGCGDACPVFPGKRYEDWPVDDPAGRDLDSVRRIRDDIERRVLTLLETLP